MPHDPLPMSFVWLRRVMVAFGVLTLTAQAGAVITVTGGYTGIRTIVMRVGSASGVVDVVQFDVANAPVGDSQSAIIPSVNGNGTPVIASSGAVPIFINMRAATAQTFRLTVTSPANLTCTSGGCGSATIPFSAIRWTSTTVTGAANWQADIKSDTFVPNTTQVLTTFPGNIGAPAGFNVTWNNTMTFSYNNATAYPAGSYTGRVTYTATYL